MIYVKTLDIEDPIFGTVVGEKPNLGFNIKKEITFKI